MKYLIAFLFPVMAYAQTNPVVLRMTDTVETAFGSVAATYAQKLSARSYEVIDVINDTDCDVQVRFDNATDTPATVVLAGTFETINFGANGGYMGSAVSLQKMSGETCTIGSVYIKGIY